jgi:DNA-binding CsgD family transcriptional regulator
LRCLKAAEQARYRLVEWLEWMELEIDNVRYVIRRCVDRGDTTRGLVLVTSLGYYWITRGTTEGVRWLDQLLTGGEHDDALLALAYHMRGFLALLQSNPAAALPAFDRAIAAGRAGCQSELLPQSIALASIADNMAGDHASAQHRLAEAQTEAAGLDDLTVRITLLQAQALNSVFAGDIEEAASVSAEGARLSEEIGDLYSLEMMMLNRGTAALISGDLGAAKALLGKALRIAERIDDRIAQYYLLGALGYHATCSGQPRLATQLLGAGETVRTGAGASVIPTLAPLLAQVEESARAALGASKFQAEFQAGKRLARAAAIRLALGEPAPVAAPAAVSAGAGVLGRREAEVAGLVAEGLSNKQIGTRLFISERTVDGHVRNILNKLGFNSRAQIAAWIATAKP